MTKSAVIGERFWKVKTEIGLSYFRNKLDAKKARGPEVDGKYRAIVHRGPDHPKGETFGYG